MKSEMFEEWRPVKGYEGLYEVSSLGRVRSLDRWVESGNGAKRLCKGQMLKLRHDKDGYLRAGLCFKQKVKNAQTHRLVAQAFIPNPDSLPQVNHKDEVKDNNRVDNLEWCTAQYNLNYGTKIARQAASQKGQKRPTVAAKLKGITRSEETKRRSTEAKRRKMKPVLQFALTGKLLGEFESVKEAGRQTGIHYGNICNACLGRFHTAGGYKWSYK